MSDTERLRFLIRVGFRLLKVLAATLATCCLGVAQQSQPLLQITSPADGRLFSPGQSVSVSVTSPAGIQFAQVFVIGEDPLGFSNIASSAPSQFTLLIPVNLSPRKY